MYSDFDVNYHKRVTEANSRLSYDWILESFNSPLHLLIDSGH